MSKIHGCAHICDTFPLVKLYGKRGGEEARLALNDCVCAAGECENASSHQVLS